MTDDVAGRKDGTDSPGDKSQRGADNDSLRKSGGGSRRRFSLWTLGLAALVVFIFVQMLGWFLTTPRLGGSPSSTPTSTATTAAGQTMQSPAPIMIGAVLTGAELAGSSLRGANLSNAALDRADFDRADLRNADLSNAEGDRTSFVDACLQNTRWHESRFRRVELNGADLRGADLSRIRDLDIAPGAIVIADSSTKWPNDALPDGVDTTDDASESTCQP
jgi:hypothetical protein